MILWLNGPFGGGKTSTAEALAAARPDWRIFDPEMVGYFLRAALPDISDVDDFQDWAAWRPLVMASLHEVSAQTRQPLVAPQSVLREDYFSEIIDGLAKAGHQTFHVLLDAPELVLRQRILAVEEAQDWRLAHLPIYLNARGWMADRADLVLDTSQDDPTALARSIIEHIAGRP